MKKILFSIVVLFIANITFSQSSEQAAVSKVLATYKLCMEKQDKETIKTLFSEDAIVYENGDPGDKAEDFMKEHMFPEFDMFQTFTYDNYNSKIIVSGSYAYTTETYNYTIVLKRDGKPIIPSSMGVATAVLKKTTNGWKIVSYHSSYRKNKPTN